MNKNKKSVNANVEFENSLYTNRFLSKRPANYIFQFDNATFKKYLELSDRDGELSNRLKATTLKEVTITAKTKSAIQLKDEDYASMAFRGFPNAAYGFDVSNDKDITGYTTISQYVTSKIVSLQAVSNGYVYRGSMDVSGHGQGIVELFLDEGPIDASTLESIPLSEVSYIKFFRRGGLVIANNNPALVVYLKNGSEINPSDTSVMRMKMLVGYSPKKEFYNPDYTKNDQTIKKWQDLRTTLYWDPYLLTNAANQKVKIAFFNNDFSHKLRVIVQGMNTEGKFVYMEKMIE